ncbi:MAG: glycoside hydrolase family 3 C-terminal domain-containing protein [Melioribacteraceae bacterium]|nr:glycoside hydrolase family 3 C-terminal domain-containing protein [Melioribacteraceae bacterium]MCF8431639.1 glycoside hydrolase family 3 C-terminal domain-containing protein [Melioribacteraceae bacterium]
MKKILAFSILAITIILTLPVNAQDSSRDDVESKITQLLSEMTIEEKVGQMTQITLGMPTRKDKDGVLEFEMDSLRIALLDYHVGSILNTAGVAHSLEKWHEIITTIQDVSLKESRMKIPVIYGIDAIHGAGYTLGATLFPQSIAMAATRNLELMEKGAEITAYETRASGIPWNFNPVLGMGREPLWPRHWETFGEDVYLTTQMGAAYVRGQQGGNIGDPTRVAACLKHYLGYSIPTSGRDRTPALIPERTLREILLPPFQKGIEEGCLTVMVNSGEINGIPTHSDSYVLNDILKGELNFQGFVVSDWADIRRLHSRDRVADSPKEAVRMAVMAGVDMSMVPTDFSFPILLAELVKDGDVPESRIDDAVRRILRVKFKLGLFENPYPNKSLSENFASEESNSANYKAASEVITLLENEDNTLPLSKNAKVLVTGPSANKLSLLNGGWTITWQGNVERLYPQDELTILEAVQEKIGKENVTYVEGVDFEKDINSADAIKAAENVDAVILCLGEPTYCETPGNIDNLGMSESQINFALEIAKTGKPVILVLVEGRPRVISKIVPHMEAIIMAYLPGMKGGEVISDVLFGDTNPSGKLPFTYPNGVNGYTTYDYKPVLNHRDIGFSAQWEFGHGLSYTTFNYSNLSLDKGEYLMDDTIQISVDVKNTGTVNGKESVELYVTDLFGSVSRPVKQLKRFEKIELKPGELKTVQFEIDKNDLSFFGRENKRITESGEFIVALGDQKANFFIK